MDAYDVIVIGAGCGGLTAGALLARQGRKVLVLEQSAYTGGCCSTFERDGFHFDNGASILESVPLINMAFQRLGTSVEKELDLLPCDPIYAVRFPDGSQLAVPASFEKSEDEIASLSAEDREGFQRFCTRFGEFIHNGGEDYFTSPMNSLGDFISLLRRRPVIARFLPVFLQTYQGVLDGYFKDARVLQSMSYQSFYAGHPPDLAPGIFAVIPYNEHNGVYYPRGGMVQVPAAIQRVGESFGMQVQFNQKVTCVVVDDRRRVKGVTLQDGTFLPAGVVVSDINAKTLYLDLVGEDNLPWIVRQGVRSYQESLSCPMVFLGVDFEPPLQAHHTIFPLTVEGMNDAWWRNYRSGEFPDRQFGLICWPTVTDPSLAPKDCHVINLIMMGPYQLRNKDWDSYKQRFIEEAITFIDGFAIPGLASHIRTADMATPLDYERTLGLRKGAIYGLQQDLTAEAVFRPANRSKCISGLYLAGASSHPGGGVPTTIASGMVVADLVAKDVG